MRFSLIIPYFSRIYKSNLENFTNLKKISLNMKKRVAFLGILVYNDR